MNDNGVDTEAAGNGQAGARPPWTVRAWPTLLWQWGGAPTLTWTHAATQATLGSGHDVAAGQTLWSARCANGEAAIAWDWVALREDVIALADPMAIVTNLRLVAADGEPIAAPRATMLLNVLVHGLPWQSCVMAALVGRRPVPPPPALARRASPAELAVRGAAARQAIAARSI